MTEEELEILRFPIGKFKKPEDFSAQVIQQFIADIEAFPEKLKKEVLHLSDEQLDTPYRPEGWTIRQVVHHCADSHMNSIVRFKLALTEDKPVIKPYEENKWAELTDAKMPVLSALILLEGVHQKWVFLLKSMSESDFKRTFVHPQHGRELALDVNTAIYAWHCHHHLAHITELKKSKNWN